ncbi:hypothetical protein [Microbacterium aoyamense]|uniref:hypothetical protein n=1 Tax=Microbacterium aoyamense TaxID=344166 RepID=UPI0020031266|nr:hypothetical protein [Microbacterium aoyamense]
MNASALRPPLALGAVAALLIAGLVAVPTTGPAAAAVDDPESFSVSRADQGVSHEPSLSSDGQHVAFTSTEALSPLDTNGVTDVYVSSAVEGSSDPFSGPPELISVADGADTAGDGASFEPTTSADGRFIAFTSRAGDLVPTGAAGGASNIYVRDTLLGTTTLLAPAGVTPDGDSFGADISDDGQWIVFTSRATNLVAGDADGSSDVIVADRDADGDGAYTTVSLRSATADREGDNGDTAISGNGRFLLYRSTYIDPIPGRPAGGWLTRARVSDLSTTKNLGRYTTASAIDATGSVVVAAESGTGCGSGGITAMSFLTEELFFGVMVAPGEYWANGSITDIDLSADGSTVAWSSTQPSTAAQPVALDKPVVRLATPIWRAAWTASATDTIVCDTYAPAEVDEIGEGSDPSVSASGRTVAFTADLDAPEPAASSEVNAVDRHTNEGLAVSSVIGLTDPPSFMTSFDTAEISSATIRDYGSALANAPIHKTPIHKTPIHKTPIHKTPIHKTPIHKAPIHKTPIHKTDIPGGWAELLVATPFENASPLTLTLGEVLDWAEATVADAAAPPEARVAAQRILDLTLEDIDLEASGIGALTLGALVLGAAPLSEVRIGPSDDPVADWQAVVAAQGVDVTVVDDTELAELDYAGVDISQTGVERVPLASLPIAATNLDVFDLDDLLLDGTVLGELDLAALSNAGALFTGPLTGTVGTAVAAGLARPGITAADLAAAVPSSIVLGDVLAALLDRASYPWEQISPTALDAAQAESISSWECANLTCNHLVRFRYTFDAAPGESIDFPQAVAELLMPAGTSPSNPIHRDGSGPTRSDKRDTDFVRGSEYSTFRSEARFPLGDVRSGTVVNVDTTFTITSTPGDGASTATLRVGEKTASDSLFYGMPLDGLDVAGRNRVDGEWVEDLDGPTRLTEGMIYYEWISPLYRGLDDDGQPTEGPAADEDWYLVTPPRADERLVVSTNATDGQLALALYRDETSTTSLGTPTAGTAPGTGVAEQAPGLSGDPATSGSDTVQQVEGHVLLDQESMSGTGSASVQTDVSQSGEGDLLLRVTSGNGDPSAALYALRVQYLEEPAGPRCAPWSPAQVADPGVLGADDGLTDETNTLYLVDTQRFGDTWGAASAADVRAALATMDGVNGVHGAVISVDASESVRAARLALDSDPCSMSARAELTKQINRHVSAVVGARSSQITSIVVVGGDDIVPMAPVAEHIDQHSEQSHAAELRRTTQADGSACPPSVADGAIDPCGTPIQAAAATRHILTDDPYGLASAYDTVGGTLYVPSVALGRLTEQPAQILSTIERFAQSDGVLQADSTLTGGYGAWAELPDLVTEGLAWRNPTDDSLGTSWDKSAVADALFPAGDSAAGVVSINAHFSERALLPGIPNAADNVFTPDDLFTAESVTDTASIAGSLLFTIGCHAGSQLPAAYYGPDARDWVDVFSDAAGFVGNTGYGLASDTRTALSERLLGLYADWLGVTADEGDLTTGESLVQAKRAYLAQLGVYGGYDEKVLMQAVYYGLPMYTLAQTGEPKSAPLPELPAGLEDTRDIEGDLLGASLRLRPELTVRSDEDGTSHVVADGDEVALAIVAGEPVLPKLTYRLDAAPEGTKARGAIIRDVTSQFSDELTPTLADLSVGVDDRDDATRSDIAFPSTFAHVTAQETPDGVQDLLVVTPARAQARVGGTGTYEMFTDLTIDVVYGDAASDDDIVPFAASTDVTRRGATAYLDVRPDGTGSDVTAVLALVQEKGSTEWTPYPLTKGTDAWSAAIPIAGEFRWFLQIVDAAGNVGVDTARGHLDSWGAEAPVIGDLGPDAPLTAGERLQRSVDITGVDVDDRLTATFSVTRADGTAIATGAVPVNPGADGATRATLDVVATEPGSQVLTLTACRGGACDAETLVLDVAPPNRAPTATVTVTSDTEVIDLSSTLTAHATTSDEDGDDVVITYRWLRNGAGIEGATSDTLVLAEHAQAEDVITVEASASDGDLVSGDARATVLVVKTPDPPTITAVATNALGTYASGTWSRSAVTIAYTCTSGVEVTTCPPARTVSADTGATPLVITGTVRDALGRESTTTTAVLVDKTPPVLAPTVTPNRVEVGQTATAAANATDTGSGVSPGSATCTSPVTSTPGEYTVSCSAIDVAGNPASAAANYSVTAPAATTCKRGQDRVMMPPVNADGTSVFLRLSAVPLLFTACDRTGKPIGTSGFVKSITQVSVVPLPSTAKVNEILYILPTVKPLYVKATGLWVGSIGSASLAGGKKYTYRVTLADGTSFTFTFGVR